MGKMHADLVCAPGFQGACKQTRNRFAVWSRKALQHLPVGDSRTAARAHGLLVAGVDVTADPGINRALRAIRRPPDQSEVAALQRALILVGELSCENMVGPVGLGDDHQAGGVLVEPVDDARAPDPADTREAVA